MESDAILSDELLAELGNDPNAVVLSKKRKTAISDEEKLIRSIPEEDLKKFKKLSKKEQKKFEQMAKKKVRASKQGEYMAIIKANEITTQHRDMLLSSNTLNHTATLRQQLNMLLKKEKAGIALTEEERLLLYPHRSSEGDEDEMHVPEELLQLSAVPSTIVHPKTSNIDPLVNPSVDEEDLSASNSAPLFALDDLWGAPKRKTNDEVPQHAQDVGKKNKKKKAKAGDDHDPNASSSDAKPIVESPEEATIVSPPVVPLPEPTVKKPAFSAANLGKNLLQQFSKLKEAKEQEAAESGGKKSKGGKVSTIFSSEFDLDSSKPTSTTIGADTASAEATTATKEIPSPAEVVAEPATAILEAAGNNKPAKTYLLSKKEDRFYQVRHRISIAERPRDVSIARMQLPVCQMEQEIVEAVHLNDVIVLCGETGSGKSTQVPQFLYEAGYAGDSDHMIGIAQPRRVAVTSTADRVNYEMGCTLPELNKQKKLAKKLKKAQKLKKKQQIKQQQERHAAKEAKKQSLIAGETVGEDEEDDEDEDDEDEDDEEEEDETKLPAEVLERKYYPNGRLVGYQIRYDATTVGSNTRIKFMTDGILLREISQDLLLRKYSVIILDEAHERNVNTDLLLGMLCRALPLRKKLAAEEYRAWQQLPAETRLQDYQLPLTPLKLIIMSATLRIDDFLTPRLFHKIPPVIKVEARQFPVTPHFAKRTELRHYLDEAYRKVVQIHRKLPTGGILVFLTGKREILHMCRRLQRALRCPTSASGSTSAMKGKDDGVEEDFGAGTDDPSQNQRFDAFDETAADRDNDEEDDLRVLEAAAGEGEGAGDMDVIDDFEAMLQAEADDDASVLTDIDDEDDADNDKDEQQKKKKAIGAEGNEGDERGSDAEAEKIRREMLAQVLGKPVSDTKDNHSGDSGDNDQQPKVDKDDNDEEKDKEQDEQEEVPRLKPLILPLYAMMPAKVQTKIFAAVPPGYRLIVVATNVAETSITIPNIKYVVDTGRCKEKVLVSSSASASATASEDTKVPGGATSASSAAVGGSTSAGITRYEVTWISKASADQRAGRAGRTGPGHVYRLYSANFYHEHLQAFMPPEITLTPLEDVVLHMLSLGITEIDSFPFPSNPPRTAVLSAIQLLRNLGALSHTGHSPSSLLTGSHGTDKKETNVGQAELLSKQDRILSLLTAKAARESSQQQQLQQQESLLLHQNQALVTKHQQQQQQQQALTSNNSSNGKAVSLGALSALGRWLRVFPVHPRFAKMLVVAIQTTSRMPSTSTGAGKSTSITAKQRLLAHVLTLVATLAERSVFDNATDQTPNEEDDEDENDDEEEEEVRGKTRRGKHDSDSDSEAERAQKRRKGDPSGASATSAGVKAPKKAPEVSSLFQHSAGDVMARVRATGAYLYTVQRALQTLRRERQEAQREKRRRQRAFNKQHAATDGGNEEDNEEDEEEEEDLNAAPYAKWEFAAAHKHITVAHFCSQQRLHLGTLQRVCDLRQQLQSIVEDVYPRMVPDDERHSQSDKSQKNRKASQVDHQDQPSQPRLFSNATWALPPPSAAEEVALRQILLAGYCDQIAKRATLTQVDAYLKQHQQQYGNSSHTGTTSIGSGHHNSLGSRRKRFTAYLSCHEGIGEPVYIHPQSNLYPRDITSAVNSLPEYITYTSVLKNQAGTSLYLGGVTVIHASWINDVARDGPLWKIARAEVLQRLDVLSQANSHQATSATTAASTSQDNVHQNSALPYYDNRAHQLLCSVKPRYGIHRWALPSVALSLHEILHYNNPSATASSHNDISANTSAGSQKGGKKRHFSSAWTSQDLAAEADEARAAQEWLVASAKRAVGFRAEDVEYRWFARCLLYGQVILPPATSSSTSEESMVQLHRGLLKDAQCLHQSKPHPKVVALLQRLVTRQVTTAPRLMQELQRDRLYLVAEIEELLSVEHRRRFRAQWAQLAVVSSM